MSKAAKYTWDAGDIVIAPRRESKPAANYDPKQARVPAGTSAGGQFAGGAGGAGAAPITIHPRGTPGTTREGVTMADAARLTREQARQALTYREGMATVEGENRPNRYLPAETRPQLTDLQRGALQKYSYLNDGPLNRRLRGRADWRTFRDKQGQPAGETPYSDHYFDEMHHVLQTAFDATPVLSRPVKVHRGMPLNDPAQLHDFVANVSMFIANAEHALQTGGTIQLNGYTSTSRRAGLLHTIGKALGLSHDIGKPFQGNVSLHIDAIHGIDMMPHSQLTGESEMLLNHGSQFRVKRIERKPNGDYHFHLEQLPPERKKATHNQGMTMNAPHDEYAEDVPDLSPEEEAKLEQFYREHPEAAQKFLDTQAVFNPPAEPKE